MVPFGAPDRGVASLSVLRAGIVQIAQAPEQAGHGVRGRSVGAAAAMGRAAFAPGRAGMRQGLEFSGGNASGLGAGEQ